MTSDTHDTDRYTRRKFITHSAAVAASTVAATGLASAQTATDFGGVFGHEIEVEPDRWEVFQGFISRFDGFSAPPDAETLSERARNEFVANEEAWLSYGNWILEEYDADPVESATIAIDFTLTRRTWPTMSGSTRTGLHVTFDSDAQLVERIDWRQEEPDDPDYEVELTNKAAEEAADELQRFRGLWIDEHDGDHELPTDEYFSRMGGRYFSAVSFGQESRNIIDVLLGEVQI